MKYFVGLVILLHGLIHSLGFINAYSLTEIKALTQPISKGHGVLWLLAMVVIILFVVAWFTQHRFTWLLGFCAVLVSQILIILYWKDAKFGTLPNVMMLVVSLLSYGSYHFQQHVNYETAEFMKRSSNSVAILREEEIKALPEPVKKWIRHVGAIGKPKIKMARITQRAEMKMKPDEQHWMSASALQYSMIDTPGFIWTVNAQMNAWLNFKGRDKLVDGKGEMLIKLYGLITIVDASGPKVSEGSLQRYLGEMVWLPSLAISPHIQWNEINNMTATATMAYQGTTGSGTFYFNEEGDFVKFIAMRYLGNEPDATRHEWILQVNDYAVFEGIKVPSKMTATWKLEEGDWTWLKLEVTDIRYNTNSIN